LAIEPPPVEVRRLNDPEISDGCGDPWSGLWRLNAAPLPEISEFRFGFA
jgi:hypothetical protein